MKFPITALLGVVLLLKFSYGHCKDFSAQQNTARNSLSQQSHTEEFVGFPELFDIIASNDTKSYADWEFYTFPVDIFDLAHMQRFKKNADPNIAEVYHGTALNCTVMYMDQCTSWHKCRSNCHSFGASSYRWFHDGCCECVGATCINYGVNESHCKNCPESSDDEDDFDEGNLEEFDKNWNMNYN